MANAKNSRSNKTAHVLNLLTEPGEASADAPRAERAPAAAPAPAPDNSEEVASAIRDALEEDLLAELAEEESPAAPPEPPAPAAEPEAEPEPAPAADPEPQPVPADEPAPMPEPEPQPEPPAEPSAPEPPPAEAPAPEAAQPEPDLLDQPGDDPTGGITYINVIQALVEDKVDKYMKNFHMCDCHRCRTDVIALALTSLPAKYIVVPEHESVPMLSIYESRFGAAVTAQIIAACQKVAEHPRHAGEDDGRIRLGAPRNDD